MRGTIGHFQKCDEILNHLFVGLELSKAFANNICFSLEQKFRLSCKVYAL